MEVSMISFIWLLVVFIIASDKLIKKMVWGTMKG